MPCGKGIVDHEVNFVFLSTKKDQALFFKLQIRVDGNEEMIATIKSLIVDDEKQKTNKVRQTFSSTLCQHLPCSHRVCYSDPNLPRRSNASPQNLDPANDVVTRIHSCVEADDGYSQYLLKYRIQSSDVP